MAERRESNVAFALRRFATFFRLLMKSRMAMAGFLILIVSSAIALTTPITVPFNPLTEVGLSGFRAQPEWMMYFPDGYYLSKNIVVVQDKTFSRPAALQEWAFTTAPSVAPSLTFRYDSQVGVGTLPGSLALDYSGSQPATANVTKTFHFPYHGPPARFIAQGFQVMAQGATNTSAVQVSLFIGRLGEGGREFTLWQTNITRSAVWLSPITYQLDSSNRGLQQLLRTDDSDFDPAQVILSSVNDYVYGIQVTFNAPATLHVDNMYLDIYGTAYGIFGTDNVGGDLFAQVLVGSRISLLVGLLAAFIGIALGLLVGLLAGYLPGMADEVLMRFTDMMLVIPALPLLIILVAVLGASIWNIIGILGFLGWMGFARVVRSQVLSLKERPFIEAAKAAGAGTTHILSKHVFPNIVSLTYVNLALSVPGAIISEAALSFLGLGDPNVLSWGRVLSNAQVAQSLSSWNWVIPPGLAIAVVSLSFVLIGYALDEIFNPKLRQRR